MNPLNLSSVIWLSGSKPEIENFIQNATSQHKAILIGHSANVRSQLIRITNGQNLEGLQGFIVKHGKEGAAEAAFLLLQGQVIGLLVEPEKVVEVPAA